MNDLTERQTRVFRFIESHHQRYGYPPTIREIADHIGAKWSHGIERHLQALEKKGYIKREAVKSRGIRLNLTGTGAAVPIVGRITAGKPILAVENVGESLVLDPAFVRGGETNFLLMVEGSSMKNAGILDGDLVLVRQQSTADQGEIVAALIDDEAATVKRFRQDGDRVVLEPDNPDFQPIVSDSSSVKIIGRVMAVLRLLDSQLTVKKLR